MSSLTLYLFITYLMGSVFMGDLWNTNNYSIWSVLLVFILSPLLTPLIIARVVSDQWIKHLM